ncbi:MAG: polymer-forming cytoskeletal protein [Hyphomicrobium sp.]|nr:polymer-forming cytoskeletal protein [Hyphomicrobium sp.]
MSANALPAFGTSMGSNGARGQQGSAFAPASASVAASGTSVIGADLTIIGQNIAIISQNRLQIDGDVRGDVHGKQVTISSEGSVIGTVSADEIVVHGGVKGAIRAASVVVHPTADVDAEILHRTLSIAEGARVEGRMRKSRNESELVPNLDPASYTGVGLPVS